MRTRPQSPVLPPGSCSLLPRKAVILAAGSGRRLQPLTSDRPKCLLEAAGESVLARTLKALETCGVAEVCLVVGHCAELVREAVGDRFGSLSVRYVEVPRHDTTNNLFSLWEARDHCGEDLILLEGDVLFEPQVLARLGETAGNAMAVAPCRSWHAGTVVRCAADGPVTEMLLDPEPSLWCSPMVFKTVNLYRLERAFLQNRLLPALAARVEEGLTDAFYELVLRDLIAAGQVRFSAVDVGDLRWCEVDDHRDLELAGKLFAPPAERYELVQNLHGGYWRHAFRDHCYLYNPYFPADEMFAELHRDLRAAVRDYPAGQKELAGLAAGWAGLPAEQIAVANGACELIKLVGSTLSGWTVAVPSFNEFETAAEQVARFPLTAPAFELDVEAFGKAALTSGHEAAVVVSPNNPTSRSVPAEALQRLARTLAERGCRLLVDESFLEFSREGRSLDTVLQQHPNLAILKSMSKVWGIAGLRLGYLLSADLEWVESIRRRLPIWNINGLAEAFLRMLPRFREPFRASCQQVRVDCDELFLALDGIPDLEPLPPDANFVLCRLSRHSAPEIARRLFVEDNILVKECSGKSMPEGHRYLRVASRTPRENRQLASALRRVLAN
ncbi:MAG: aminotransferase class I/II-fold pyridoxal phosphate-dependent enzyme [Armatimonadetes bacterium]|nr:aminotransferase class I/II-fold pyridoxal phosphate-dependent enzyme [Armatimonadota bacterium]